MHPRPVCAVLQLPNVADPSGCWLKFSTPTVPVRLIVTPWNTKLFAVSIPLSLPSVQRYVEPFLPDRSGELIPLSAIIMLVSARTPNGFAHRTDAGSCSYT